MRSDPQIPSGNVDSGDCDPSRFTGPCREAGVWRQGLGARGSASLDPNKGNGVSVGRLNPGAGSSLWQGKEIQYWTFTKRRPARESAVLKHSNKLAHSHSYTVNILLFALTGLNKYLRQWCAHAACYQAVSYCLVTGSHVCEPKDPMLWSEQLPVWRTPWTRTNHMWYVDTTNGTQDSPSLKLWFYIT